MKFDYLTAINAGLTVVALGSLAYTLKKNRKPAPNEGVSLFTDGFLNRDYEQVFTSYNNTLQQMTDNGTMRELFKTMVDNEITFSNPKIVGHYQDKTETYWIVIVDKAVKGVFDSKLVWFLITDETDKIRLALG